MSQLLFPSLKLSPNTLHEWELMTMGEGPERRQISTSSFAPVAQLNVGGPVPALQLTLPQTVCLSPVASSCHLLTRPWDMWAPWLGSVAPRPPSDTAKVCQPSQPHSVRANLIHPWHPATRDLYGFLYQKFPFHLALLVGVLKSPRRTMWSPNDTNQRLQEGPVICTPLDLIWFDLFIPFMVYIITFVCFESSLVHTQ